MGGTYHLPRLVGLPTALDMILTGKNIRPDKAKKMGLVDLVVDEAMLEKVAIQQALGLVNGKVKPHERKDKMGKLMEMIPPGRNFIFKKAKEQVDKSTGGKYPAPYAILDVLSHTYGMNKMEAFAYEGLKFSELAATSESAALIGIFKGMTAVKKHDFGKPKHEIKTVGVLGAGLMEIPPESKVTPLPTNTMGFSPVFPPLYSKVIKRGGCVLPLPTAKMPPIFNFSIAGTSNTVVFNSGYCFAKAFAWLAR